MQPSSAECGDADTERHCLSHRVSSSGQSDLYSTSAATRSTDSYHYSDFDADNNADLDANANSHGDTHPNFNPDEHTDRDTNADPDPFADIDADTDSNCNTDQHSDFDADPRFRIRAPLNTNAGKFFRCARIHRARC